MRVTVEDLTGVVGHPAAGITVRDVTGMVEVWRQIDGHRIPVRAGRGVNVLGEDFIEDHETPTNREIVYGVTGPGRVEATARLTVPSRWGWLSDPLDHTSPLRLGTTLEEQRDGLATLLAATAREATYGQAMSLVNVMGASRSVMLGGRRQAPTGVTVRVLTQSVDQARAMLTLVEAGGPLLLRLPDVESLTACEYLAGEWRTTATRNVGWTVWEGHVSCVRAPATPVVIARATYGQVRDHARGMTYAQARGRAWRSTYGQVKRDPGKVQN